MMKGNHNNTPETLLARLRKAALSPRESRESRERLLQYMAHLPVRNRRVTRLQGYKGTIRSLLLLDVIIRKPMGGLIVGLIVALTAGGGVSLAAESALPGSALYPVKTEVNERVRGALTLSSEAKGEFDARVVERRLEEAEALAARGELSSEIRARLEQRFTARAERAEDRAARLEREGRLDDATAIRARLDAALGAHVQILERLDASLGADAEADADTRVEVRDILEDVRVRARAAGEAHTRSEADVSARLENIPEAAVRGKITAAENVLSAARETFDNRKDEISARARAAVEADLNASAEALTRAEAHAEAGEFRQAFLSAQEALRLAHRARAHMRGSLRVRSALQLRLDVGASVETEVETTTDASAQDEGDDEERDTDGRREGDEGPGVRVDGSVDAGARGSAGEDDEESADVEGGAGVDVRLEI